ncbi:MAG TPA: response regulator transcription factor [Gaiellaceae bacterium]|nr:response regulator transcription factor [Gaiellaceae bacterium]
MRHGKRRLFVAVAQPLLAFGIREAIRNSALFEFVGHTCDPDELGPLIEKLEPELLLIGDRVVTQPPASVELIKRRAPRLGVVVLGPSSEGAMVRAALDDGAAGYIVNTVESHELEAALRAVVVAREFVVVGVEPGWRHGQTLTRRELQIIEYVAKGFSNKNIAEALWVSQQTVKFHLSNAFPKLGVSNRTEAVLAAYRLNLLSRDETG